MLEREPISAGGARTGPGTILADGPAATLPADSSASPGTTDTTDGPAWAPGIQTEGLRTPTPGGWRRRWALLAVDCLGLSLAAVAALLFGIPLPIVALATPLTVLALRCLGLYSSRKVDGALGHLSPLTFAVTASSLISASVAGAPAGRGLSFAAMALGALFTARSISYSVERRVRSRRPSKVLIVGTGPAAQEFADRLLRHPSYGMTPIGFLSSGPTELMDGLDLPLLGPTELLPHLAGGEFAVDRVVVDTGSCPEEELVPLLYRTSASGVEVAVLPTLARHLSTAVSVEAVAGMTVLAYRANRKAGAGWIAKRIVDVAGASLALLLTAPIWLACALAIKVDSPGPVLFRQARIGRGGRMFEVLKLRSMCVEAEAARRTLIDLNECDGPFFKVSRDPRVTRVGRVLRRWSLDELPQLINVIKGDMSLVGPRPSLPEEIEQSPTWFRHRLEVRPGLTGLWQVSGRFLLPFHETSRLDVFYVDHWSLGLDARILLRTPAVVMSGRGAR